MWVAATLAIIIFLGWLLWPYNDETRTARELSQADGNPRFYATTYPERTMPPRLTLRGRVMWFWMDYRRRHGKPFGVVFMPRPVGPHSIQALLDQCMDATGTQYLLAVEVAGVVEFGTTNTLSGPQFAQAAEHALETSQPVVCYDYVKKRNFMDTLLVIRERPRLVKIVPASKLTQYRQAGLVQK